MRNWKSFSRRKWAFPRIGTTAFLGNAFCLNSSSEKGHSLTVQKKARREKWRDALFPREKRAFPRIGTTAFLGNAFCLNSSGKGHSLTVRKKRMKNWNETLWKIWKTAKCFTKWRYWMENQSTLRWREKGHSLQRNGKWIGIKTMEWKGTFTHWFWLGHRVLEMDPKR